tara:strand:+ start:2703 stop:3308 length:606 start_codon:yes stop_codon:yes gene_type:complete
MKNERLSWDNYFSKIVNVTSERSPCERLQVGCLLVKDNRIISQGYNGFLPGCPHTSIVRDNHEQATLHAEQNALIDCAKRGVTCNGSTVYVTHYPCIICCRLLLASGVKDIKYLNDYKNDDLVNHFCKECNVPITKLIEYKDDKKEYPKYYENYKFNYVPFLCASLSFLAILISKFYNNNHSDSCEVPFGGQQSDYYEFRR